MKIALTGSNGFLGSHIVKAFLNDDHEIIALVRPVADISSLPKHKFLHIQALDYQGDLQEQFDDLKNEFGILDLFVHNAGVTVSLNPSEYFEINTDLTGKIIHAVKATNWMKNEGKLVYVSSLTAQGPIGLDKPVSKYGESKLKAEGFFKKSKYKHLIIRPTAIYGAGDYAFLPLVKGANGKVYPLTNKHQKMSMIHGADLARMILIESQNSTGTLHAADGVTYLHSDFIEALSKVLDKKIFAIPIPVFLSKIILEVSDIWHRLTNRRPSITKEKFLEITMDWNQQEYNEIPFSEVPCKISLEEGFRDAYNFYKEKRLI